VKLHLRSKPVAFGLVALLGLGLIAFEVYVLSPDVRAPSVSTLERAGFWDTLVGLLDDDDHRTWAEASEALVRHSTATTPALERGLDRLTDHGRAQAARALGRIGIDAHSAIPALRRHMTEDDSDEVREAAAKSPGLVGRDDPAVVREILGKLVAGDDRTRIAAARAGTSLNESDRRRVVQLLIGLLKHPTGRVRAMAAEALSDLAWDARPAVPALVEALADSDPTVREEAAEALENFLHGPGLGDVELYDRINPAIGRARTSTGPGDSPQKR
jgi:HEAT repeat protein